MKTPHVVLLLGAALLWAAGHTRAQALPAVQAAHLQAARTDAGGGGEAAAARAAAPEDKPNAGYAVAPEGCGALAGAAGDQGVAAANVATPGDRRACGALPRRSLSFSNPAT